MRTIRSAAFAVFAFIASFFTGPELSAAPTLSHGLSFAKPHATHSLASGGGLNQLTGQARTFYRRVFIKELLPRLVFNLFGRPDSIPLREGRTISWPTMGALEAGETLAEGGDGTEATLSLSSKTATLADYGKYHRFSSHVALNAPDPVLEELVVRLAKRASRDLDSVTRDVLKASSNIFRPSTYTLNSQITAADVLDATLIQKVVASFDANDVEPVTSFINPTGGIGTVTGEPSYVAFAHAHVINDLRKNAATNGFITVDKYQAGNVIFPGEAGKIGQVRFLNIGSQGAMTANIGASSLVDVYHTIVIGADAFGVVDLDNRPVEIMAVPPSQISHANPLGRRGSVGYVASHAAAILIDNAVAVLNTASSYGVNT